MFKSLICLLMLLGAAEDQAKEKAKEESKLRQEQVARAARMYRIEVYESFRLDRDEYNRRRAMGDELLSSWDQCNQTIEQAELVAGWFENSRGLVVDNGTEAQFAAAPDLPKKVTPEETTNDSSLVSTESPTTSDGSAATTPSTIGDSPGAAPPALPSSTVPGDATGSEPGNETSAAAASATDPLANGDSTLTTEQGAAAPTLLNALGKALVDAATEAAKPAAEAPSADEGASVDAATLAPLPLERSVKESKKPAPSTKGKAMKKKASPKPAATKPTK